jgi:transposase
LTKLVIFTQIAPERKTRSSTRAQALIHAAGGALVLLPTYLPDFNPIEQVFATCKQTLRRVGARSWESVVMVVSEALCTVSEADTRTFFAPVGVPLPCHVLRTAF